MKNLWQVITLTGAMIALVGCSGEVEVTAENDFANVVIISKVEKLVGQNSIATVTIRFRNSNNRPVLEYTPNLEAIFGESGIDSISCTETDAYGVSICTVEVHTPGLRKFRIAKHDLNFEHDFSIVNVTTQPAAIAASAKYKTTTTAGGYRVSSEITGLSTIQQTAGGYKVKSSIITVNDE